MLLVGSASRVLNVLGFVPGHNVGPSDVIEAGEEGEGGKDDGGDEELPLVEDLDNGWLLKLPTSVRALHSI